MIPMNPKAVSLFLTALFIGLAAHGQSPQSNSAPPPVEERLAALRALKIDAGTITLAEHEVSPTLPGGDARAPKNLPPRTIVKIVLQPAKGSNINVEIWLPDADKWNARLLGLGNGGSAGHISPGTLAGPMAGGYAAATTDMGTAPNADSGIGNPEVWKDFGFRATHLMTVVAKQVVTAYYGKAPELSYFSGGSTGGQQALQEAQRYPEDYDGITAAVPAHCRTPLHAYFLWNDQILKKCPFTKAQDDNVIAAGNEYMAPREIPPIAGKFVSDPRCTSKDIEAVIALALQKDPTLTPEHARGAAQTLRRTAPCRHRRTHLQRHPHRRVARGRARAPLSFQVGLRRRQEAGGHQLRRGHRYLYRRARALSQCGKRRPERL